MCVLILKAFRILLLLLLMLKHLYYSFIFVDIHSHSQARARTHIHTHAQYLVFGSFSVWAFICIWIWALSFAATWFESKSQPKRSNRLASKRARCRSHTHIFYVDVICLFGFSQINKMFRLVVCIFFRRFFSPNILSWNVRNIDLWISVYMLLLNVIYCRWMGAKRKGDKYER